MSNRKSILITGASGLLGSNLVMAYKGFFEVYGTCYQNTYLGTQGVHLVSVDLRDSKAVSKMVEQIHPDIIIHAAALTDVDECERFPVEADRMNRDATVHLLKLCKQLKSKFVFISTDALYNSQTQTPSSESGPLFTLSHYARSKREAEEHVLGLDEQSLVIRTCIYGWNLRSKKSFADAILAGLENGTKPTLFRDAFFSPVLVNDLADIILELLDRDARGVYNVGSSDSMSKFEFGKAIARHFNYSESEVSPIKLSEKKLLAFRPSYPVMDVSKVTALLGRSMPTIDFSISKFKLLLENGYVEELKRSFHYVKNSS